ncbi:MAG: Ig-like domain-containing protein [Lachnospiraceae bacterium]|nr:Ig-like domain-containing protein [Lachnospiraceae bacterium]
MHGKRKIGKAFFTVLLSTLLAFSMFAGQVFAKEGYFYNQLNDKEKSYFKQLDADSALKKGTSSSTETSGSNAISAKSFSTGVMNAFFLDNVDLFWLSEESGFTYYGDPGTKFIVNWKKYVDWQTGSRKSKLSADINEVNAAVDALADGAKKKSATDLKEQLLYVHDQLVATNVYNSAAAEKLSKDPSYPKTVTAIPWTPLSALLSGESPVCEGYSRAFKMVCDKLGIECIIVGGTAYHPDGTPEGHMWNYVKLDGAWYAVDVTWDDPVVKGSSKVVSGKERTDYFLVGSTTKIDGKNFSVSHVADDYAGIAGSTLKYPTLATTAYKGGDTPTPTPTPTKPTKIKTLKISGAKSIAKDTSITLTPKITPSNATNKQLTWKVTSKNAYFKESNLKTLTKYEGNPTLVCNGTGDVKIQVKATDGSNKSANITIKGPKSPTGITVKAKPTNVKKLNEPIELSAKVKPEKTAVYDTIEWKITSKNAYFSETDSDTLIANDLCHVYCYKGGKITIKANVKVGTKTVKSVTLKLKGLDNPKAVKLNTSKVKVTGTDGKKKKFNATKLNVGDTFKLSASVTPNNAYDKTIKWKSSDETKATVDENGNVTCVSAGKVKITAYSGVKASVKKFVALTIK